jgi:hypothetical protein
MVSAGPPLLDLGLILRARLQPDDTGDGPWNCAPDRVQRYVVSSTLTEPGWQQTTVLAGSPIQRVRALKERPGTSSSRQHRLCHPVIGAGLVVHHVLPLRRRLSVPAHAQPEAASPMGPATRACARYRVIACGSVSFSTSTSVSGRPHDPCRGCPRATTSLTS